MNSQSSNIDSPSSVGSFSDALRHFRKEQVIYSQGAHANTLFYIQEGGVYLATSSKYKPSVVTAILGVGDFFGDPCLIGFPDRVSTAIALTSSSICVIKKEPIIRKLRGKNNVSNSFLFYLLSITKKYRDHVAELLTLSAEQRLACILLRLAHLDRRGSPIEGVITANQQILADMVGTTRSRLNFFMNRFRKRGFLNYRAGRIEVYESLQKVLERR